MKKITFEELDEAIGEAIESWSIRDMACFVRENIYADAVEKKYAILCTDSGKVWFDYAVDDEDEAELDDDAEIFEIDGV